MTALDKIPQGKPTWILVRSSKQKNGDGMDAAFYEVKSRFKGRVNFRVFDWEDEETESIVDEFTLGEAPASVLKDAKGRVVEKFEGSKSVGEMSVKMNSLIAGADKPKKTK